MMASPVAMLFDLDGTVLDTAPDLGNALNVVLQEYGLPQLGYEQYRNVASHGAMGLLKQGFGEKLADYDYEPLRQQLLSHYYANICVDTCLFDGVDVLLQRLTQAGLPWGIVTNKPGWLTDKLLPHFAIFEDCAVVISGDTLAKRKPDPEPLLHAAKQIDKAPGETWYIGDAERDIQSARAAGMVSVIAEYGYISERDAPHDWQADLSVKSAYELIKHIA